jgi:hypothetical protein
MAMSFFDSQVHAAISDMLEVFILAGLTALFVWVRPKLNSVLAIVSVIKTEYELAEKNMEVLGGRVSKKIADKLADQVVKPD